MTTKTKARVESITPLTNSILQLTLQPDQFIPYQAGHYLKLLFQDNGYEYSIANAPLGAQKYELHIRHTQDNPYNEPLLAHIKQTGSIDIAVPFGNCSITKLHPTLPIICIAAGTGFAPIKAIIEQLLADADTRPCKLYWSVRSKNDLYLDEQVIQWQRHVSDFEYYPCVSKQQKDNILSLLLKTNQDKLQDYQFVLAGPFDMVYTVRDQLLRHHVKPENMFSDAFDFE